MRNNQEDPKVFGNTAAPRTNIDKCSITLIIGGDASLDDIKESLTREHRSYMDT